jgi:hypothetical protein
MPRNPFKNGKSDQFHDEFMTSLKAGKCNENSDDDEL